MGRIGGGVRDGYGGGVPGAVRPPPRPKFGSITGYTMHTLDPLPRIAGTSIVVCRVKRVRALNNALFSIVHGSADESSSELVSG